MIGAPRHVAVVGSGISGLAAARRLTPHSQVTLFEADSHFGGHAHTVDLTLHGVTHGVDTGFLVFNHATYPGLVKLFDDLAVPTAASEMSFSVQVPGGLPGGVSGGSLEWSGCNLDTVFAQRRNLLRPRFLGMLRDLLRFNRLTTRIALQDAEGAMQQPIADFLRQHRFSSAFRDWYLLPMLGCIWSCPTDQMLQFPVATMIRFCHNHGLIRVTGRPQWFTVQGGSREYVQRLVAQLADTRLHTRVTALRRVPPGTASTGVWLDSAGPGGRRSEHFDAVVLAGHSDQSLALLGGQASADERRVLGAIRYHRNRAVLHTDARLLPRHRKAWAAWNYERSAAADTAQPAAQPAVKSAAQSTAHLPVCLPVCLHYWINRLQPLPWQTPVVVSLNPCREPDPATVHGEFDYAHPVFDRAATAAQAQLPLIQGAAGVWFAGAWTRYGFHEDGLRSGLAAADAMLAQWALQDPAREAA